MITVERDIDVGLDRGNNRSQRNLKPKVVGLRQDVLIIRLSKCGLLKMIFGSGGALSGVPRQDQVAS